MSTQKIEPEVYAFNERGHPEDIIESEIYQLLLKLKAGKATPTDKQRIFDQIQNCSNYGKKRVALAGNFIDFSKWLKRYWVLYRYGHIQEYYAFSKSNLRKNIYTRTGIIKIVEVKG